MTKPPETPEPTAQPTPSAVAPGSALPRFVAQRVFCPLWWVFTALYAVTGFVAACCVMTLWIAAILLADDFSCAGFIVACALAAGTGAMVRLAWRMLDLAEEAAKHRKPNVKAEPRDQ